MVLPAALLIELLVMASIGQHYDVWRSFDHPLTEGKKMKKLFAAAALATAALTAPAFADGHTQSFAIMHFNMDQDSASDRRMVPSGLMQVELTPGSTLKDVFNHLNMDADRAMDVSGTGAGGVTILMRDPTMAADIFRRLMEESREDE